ncbi:PAS domain S-box protein [Salinibaculum rarum]|uniref:PAS domain S-box protein n=1 Tax=Salinibaculum rarum TaxID=3058903 RepID=UPI00265DDC73|nr:PAS domain S-box protein [Salinibaculum sp. KK48]
MERSASAGNREGRVGALDILLVEDDPTDARLITEYLNGQAGPKGDSAPAIRHVERLSGALDARDADIDVILLDLGLPDSDRFDTLETMLDASGDEPVVVLTGIDDDGVGVEAIQRGAQDYLVKDDLTPKLLRQTIQYAIERESQQRKVSRADTVFQNAQDGLFVIDVEDDGETFRVNRVNPAYETFTDAPAGELQRKTIRKLVDEADVASIREKYRECVSERTSLEYEEYLSAFDGGSWWETRIAPVIADGEVTQVVGSTRNITERKEREQRLQQFEQMVEHTGHAVFFTDVDGQIEYVNPEFEELTGYAPADALGETPDLLSSGEHDDAFFAELWDTVLDGDVWSGEIVNERKDGAEFVANHTIAPVMDDSGDVTHFVAIYDDITDRKERERRLQTHELVVQAMNEVAFLINEDKRIQFANDAALDFADVPLEAIKGIPIESVTEEMAAPDEEPHRFVDAIDALLEDEQPDVGEWVREPDGSDTLSLEFDLFLESVGEVCAEQRFVPVKLYDGGRGVAVISRDITERREKEEEIQTHLEQAQEVGNVGSWHLDIDTNDLRWSDECYRIFGLEPGTPMSYERFLELVHPEDLEKVDEAWSEALEEGSYDIEHRIVVDGKTRWVQETAKVEFDEDGEPESGIGVVRDITEQVQQTREIRAQKDRYESLLQSAPDPVFVADTNTGEVIEANGAAEALREQDHDEIVGMDQSKLHPPDEREQARAEFNEAAADDGGVWRTYSDGSQIHAVSSTGETVPVEITHNTFSLPKGRVSYAIFRDITEQIEREREILEQKERYESLFNSVSGAVVVTDIDGTITTCNPGFADLFGYESDDIEGNHLSTIADENTDVERLLETTDTSREALLRDFRKQSGQVFPGETRSLPLRTHNGDIKGHVVHIIDVSEEQANREQLQVLSRVFRHNVRNDMNVIQGRAEVIESHGSTAVLSDVEKILETSREFIEMAENQHKITELLTETAETVDVDLTPTIRQVVSDVQTQYPDATVQTDLDPNCQASTRREIAKAIRELVENAIIHSDQANPRVNFHLRDTETMAELTVRDDGPGIPEQEWNVLKADGEINALNHGTGLGLWFVNQVVRRSNGTMSFDTNDSGGSTVTVRLPTS